MLQRVLLGLVVISCAICSALNAATWEENHGKSNQIEESVLQLPIPGPDQILTAAVSEVSNVAHNIITAANISMLYYLTFSSKLDNVDPSASGFISSTALSDVLLSDDSPFQEVDFPWPFLFNGRWVSSAFIGPNGALHFSKEQPCYPYNTFSVANGGCNLQNSYYDLIAGFLADLDPVGCSEANLTYFENSGTWTVLFSDFCYYGSTLNNTFSISLFDDDHIMMSYFTISTSSSLPTPAYYVSGIRPPSDNTYLAFVSADKTTSASVWYTAITGYYPASTSYVRSGYAFTMCPVSLFWCMQNSTLSLDSFESTATSLVISLSTIKLSCIDDIEYGLAYSQNSIVNTSEIINCAANITSMTLSCSVDTKMKYFVVDEVGSSSSSTVLLWVVWRSLSSVDVGSGGNWTVIPSQSLPLTVTSSPVSADATRTVCNYNIADCSTKDLYDGNYTCLNRSCFTTANGKASLFSTVNCEGTCANTDTITAPSTTFITDPNGDCCTVTALDCAGYCNGNNVDALQLDATASEICCASIYNVDCSGVCQGTALTNPCNGACLASGTPTTSCYAIPTAKVLTASTIGTLFYATYSSSFNASSFTDYGGSTPSTLVDLLHTDDSPFYQLDLSTSILFSGRLVSIVFINPNGAVQYSKKQPCYPSDVFQDGFGVCDYDNSYYDLLAVFMTNLNPNTATNANITFSSDEAKQTLYFENFPYFDTKMTNSFAIRWYSTDDRIEMIYVNITKIGDFPISGEWISGIRPAQTNPLIVFDSTDSSTSSTVWSTDITGSYPSTTSDVATDMTFTMCPQSVFWCMTPSILNQSALSQMEDVRLNLTTIKLSCIEDLSYTLIYSLSATYRNNSNTISCTNTNITTMSLTCILPRRVIDSYKSNVTLYLWVAWITSGAEYSSASTVRVLPMQPLELLLSSTMTRLSSNGDYMCNNKIGGCSAASMAMGDFSCLNQTCYDGSLRSIFNTETCANTCSASDATTEYVTGADNHTCCLIGDLDCAGYCYGNNTVAYNNESSFFCCPSTSTIDCAGVCDGTSVINICGVCTSTDIYGTACYNVTQLVIETGETDGNIYPTFDFTQPPFISNDLITLRNTGSVDFLVIVTSFPDETIAPALTYADNVTVPAYGEQVYWVNSSLVELYNGSMTYWVVKTLTFTFSRIDDSTVEYSKAITMRPKSSGCADILRDTCIRLPGCIYCLGQRYPIILRTSPASTSLYTERRLSSISEAAVDEAGDQHWLRRLFVAYTPPNQVNSRNRLKGICKDGWLQNTCN